MAINKLVTMEWAGKKYPIKITMDVIDKIDDQVNLANMAIQMSNNDTKFTKVAKLFTVLLSEAGADVEVDQVFHALFGSGDITQKDVQPMINAIFAAIFPETKKKPTSRSVKAKAKPKKTAAAAG